MNDKPYKHVFMVSIDNHKPIEITFFELKINGIDPQKLLAIVEDKRGRDGK